MQQINKNEKLLRDLQSGELANELQALSIAAASPEVKPAAVAKNTLPLGALSPHRSAVSNGASYRSSGLSTPTKKDSHGYTWNAKPDPLPLPPGTPEWRKQRRQTTEHELQLLRTGGFAARSK